MKARHHPRTMDPEDYVQEVLLPFWEKLQAGTIESSPTSYLWTMIRNRVATDLRKPFGLPSSNNPIVLKNVPDPGPGDMSGLLDLPEIVEACYQRLPGVQGTLFRFVAANRLDLYDQQDMYLAAFALGWSEDACKKNRQRLLRTLRLIGDLGLQELPPKTTFNNIEHDETWELVAGFVQKVADCMGTINLNLDKRNWKYRQVLKDDGMPEEVSRHIDGCIHLIRGQSLLWFLTAASEEPEFLRSYLSWLVPSLDLELAASACLFRLYDSEKFAVLSLYLMAQFFFLLEYLTQQKLWPYSQNPQQYLKEGLEITEQAKEILRGQYSDHPVFKGIKDYFEVVVPSAIRPSPPGHP